MKMMKRRVIWMMMERFVLYKVIRLYFKKSKNINEYCSCVSQDNVVGKVDWMAMEV